MTDQNFKFPDQHPGNGSEHLFTGKGDDSFHSGAGKTSIPAGSGTDSIAPTGSGAPTVDAGTDTTFAFGNGVDSLKVEHGQGTITVTGFDSTADTLNLSALGIKDASALQSAATIAPDGNGGTSIDFKHGPSVDLTGVSMISTSDFTFASATTHHADPAADLFHNQMTIYSSHYFA